METRNYVGLGIGIVILIALLFFVGGSLILTRGGLMGSASIGSAEQSDLSRGGSYASPTYHVFNYANSMAMGVMLFVGAIAALLVIDRLSVKTRSLLAMLLYIVGSLLIFAGVTVFVFGVHDLLTFKGVGETTVQPTVFQQFGWLIESVVFLVLGAACTWAGEFVRRKEGEDGSLTYLVLAPVASVIALFALGTFIFGMIGLIFSPLNRFEWIIETLVFGGIGLLLFNKIDAMRKEQGEDGSWRKYFLYASGVSLILPAFALFLFWTKVLIESQTMGASEFRYLTWGVVDSIVFAALGFASFYLIDRIEGRRDKRESALYLPFAFLGFFLFITAVFTFIFGFDSLVSSHITASNYRASYAWIVEALLYGLLGFFSLRQAHNLKNEKELALTLESSGGLFSLVFLFNFFFAVEGWASGSNDAWNLTAKVIVHGLASLALFIYADKLQDRKILPKALSYTGILFLLAGLLSLVFGLHSVLYSTQPDYKFLGKIAAYAIAGAILLFAGNRLQPLFQKKQSDVFVLKPNTIKIKKTR